MNDDDNFYDNVLATAGRALRQARSDLAVATYSAKALTREAATDGEMSEAAIARALGIDRNTVREWLGKPRKR